MTAENYAGVARLKIEAGSDLMKTRKSHPRQRLCENADTTGLQPVVSQFQPREQNSGDSWIPPTLVAWRFNFYLTLQRRRRPKLKLHATKVGGIQEITRPAARLG